MPAVRFLPILPLLVAGLTAATAEDAPPASAEAMAAMVTGDPAAGERVFGTCRACHVVDSATNRVGPHLVGLFGRAAGTVEGFNYSEAMRTSGITWTPETLSTYLADPRGTLPGNRMAFGGVRDETQRADLIAYLFAATATDSTP